MAFSAGAISAVLKLDADPYAQGMLKATSIAQAFPATVTTFLTNPMLSFGLVMKDVIGGLKDLFVGAAAYGDEMGELAAAIGVSVEQLTSLGEVAALAGSSTQGVADAYRFLGRAVHEAVGSAGSDAAKTFRSLGVEFVSAEGTARPLGDVMLSLADAFQKLPEGGARTSTAMSLLGRSGTELVPTLIQGTAALRTQMDQMVRYGVTVNANTGDTAGRWNDSMDEMKIAYRGLTQSLGDAIRPALLPHLETLTAWTRTHQPLIRDAIGNMVDSAVNGFAKLGAAFDFIGDHWRTIAAVAGGTGAYIAGPAVLGAVKLIGPALLATIAPMNAVRAGILGIQLALNPLGSLTKVFSVALAGLTAYVIMQPEALKALQSGLQYVGQVAAYVGDVFSKSVGPSIGRIASEAFERLRAYLPSTADMFSVVDVAGRALERGMNTLAGFVVGRVIPAFDTGLRTALVWIQPAMTVAGNAFLGLLDVLSGVADWIVGPGYDAIAAQFSMAWATLEAAVQRVRPAFEDAWAAMAGVVGWIEAKAVPVVGEQFANAWDSLRPVLLAVGGYVGAVYEAAFAPFVGWIVKVAVPAVVGFAGVYANIIAPMLRGVGSVLLGIWDIGRGLFGWYVPMFKAAGMMVALNYELIAAGWTNVLQPLVGWLWSVVKPVAEFFYEMLGYILDRVGKTLSWIGKLIGGAAEATAAMMNIPGPPASATGPGAGMPQVNYAMPSPTTTPKVFDFRGDFTRATDALKELGKGVGQDMRYGVTDGLGDLKGVGESAGKALAEEFSNFKMPALPDFTAAGGLGRVGEGAGVTPLQERLNGLKNGTAGVVDQHEAAVKGVLVDPVRQRREFAQAKAEHERRLRDARRRGAGDDEIERLRDEKETDLRTRGGELRDTESAISNEAGRAATAAAAARRPVVNVSVAGWDDQKFAKIVIDGVAYTMSKQVDQAVAAAAAIRHQASVSGGL